MDRLRSMIKSGEIVGALIVIMGLYSIYANYNRNADRDDLLKVMEEVHFGIPFEVRNQLAQAIVKHVPPKYRMVMLALAFGESSFRPNAVGDGGTSFGMYQLRRKALEDVQKFEDPNFPVPESWQRLVQEDIAYATEGAWKYLHLNLRSRARANGDLALALTMHRTGPDVGRAQSLRNQGQSIINIARAWEARVGWDRLR